jgi:hypothetical protein
VKEGKEDRSKASVQHLRGRCARFDPLARSDGRDPDMKKVIGVTLATIVLLLSSPLRADAVGGSHGRSGSRGHSEGREHHEFREHPGFRRHFGTGVFIGSGFWWGPDWWGPAYPYYAEPPVIVPQEPPAYIQPEPQPQYYWYYCQNPPAYYPYVQQCPGGWMTVVPPTSPPAP